MTATAQSSGAVSDAVARVEAELGQFWGAPDPSGEAEAKARASTMNFVVAVSTASRDAQRAAVEDLAQTRAGRAFLLTVDGRLAPWEIAHDVNAVCRREGADVVCYDRVELSFGAMAAVRVASVVEALALSEVPTYVEVGPGAPATLVDPLVAVADRVIVDSAHTSVRRIAELCGKTRAPVADRAFVRTFTWRELVARFFDDALPALRAIQRVEVRRTTDPRRDPAALLLGWLAARLGWAFTSRTRAITSPAPLRPGAVEAVVSQEIAIEVLADDRADLGPGELTGIAFSGTLEGAPFTFRALRGPDPRVIAWTREGARTDEHNLPLGFRDETWVLTKAIDATEGDRLYRDAVAAAAGWEAR